jgi:hypothetical protein
MLNAAAFSSLLWELLDRANGKKEELKKLLSQLPREDLLDFHKEFLRALSNLWEGFDTAGSLEPRPGEHLSEDTLEDVFAYVVSKGRDYYDEIVNCPERLRRYVHPSEVPFLGLARQVFLERFGEEIDLQ